MKARRALPFYIGSSIDNARIAEEIATALEQTTLFKASAHWFSLPTLVDAIDEHKKGHPDFDTASDEGKVFINNWLINRAEYDIEGLRNADFCIFIHPGGYGTHVEMGFALAKRCDIFILDTGMPFANPYPCVFHNHMFAVGNTAKTIHGLVSRIVQKYIKLFTT